MASNRSSRLEDSWTVLREDENVIYAALFHRSKWDCGLDEMDLLERFNTIQRSWYNE